MKKLLITAALLAGSAAWAQQPPTQAGQPGQAGGDTTTSQPTTQATTGQPGQPSPQGNQRTMNHGTMQHGQQGSTNQGAMQNGQQGSMNQGSMQNGQQGSMSQGQSGAWSGRGGPDEAGMRNYPRCSRTVTDRCIQRGGR